MKLLEVKEITQKEIDYINELTKQGMSQGAIAKYMVGEDATEQEFREARNKFKRLMRKSPYRLNEKTNQYELRPDLVKEKNDKNEIKLGEMKEVEVGIFDKKSNEKTENSELKSEPKNEKEAVDLDEVQAPDVQQEPNEDNDEDNKKRARRKPTKSNPLGIASPLDIAEIVCKSAGKKEDRVGTGVYVISKIADDFAILENELYYLPGYTLIDVALIIASHNMGILEKSKVFKRFTEIVREDKVAAKKSRNKEDEENKNKQSENNRQDENENNDKNNQQGGNKNKGNENKKKRKKQTNIKLCKESTEAINKLSHHFAFLNKSEIINLSMYALSQSAQDSFMKDKDVKNEK